jgi:hypothetical protein
VTEARSVEIVATRPAAEGPTDSPSLLEVNVVATLSVIVDGTHVFREDEVPILELASQATAWLAFGAPRAIPFQYDSQEYTEILLAFYPGRDDYWRLSFAGAASESGVTVARGTLEAATRTFVEAVRHAASGIGSQRALERVLDPARYASVYA